MKIARTTSTTAYLTGGPARPTVYHASRSPDNAVGGLRGGLLRHPREYIGPSYRNFLPAEARRQFSGLRPARGP